MNILFFILEILHRAALILGVMLIVDIAHNGEIDLPIKCLIVRKRVFPKKNSPVSKLVMKVANKLESAYVQRKRAWNYRAREEVEEHGD